MERVLISRFCSVKQMRVFDPPGWDTNPSQVSSQQMLVLIYVPKKDGKLGATLEYPDIVVNVILRICS